MKLPIIYAAWAATEHDLQRFVARKFSNKVCKVLPNDVYIDWVNNLVTIDQQIDGRFHSYMFALQRNDTNRSFIGDGLMVSEKFYDIANNTKRPKLFED